MRSVLRLLIATLVALPLFASIRGTLIEPREGVVLRGGTTAVVEWSARGLPHDAEEWEAFLSVDGGEFYAYRITPHLDLDQRRFAFEVPNVDTEHARILIRVGDEREEFELDLSTTFAIREDAALARSVATADVVDEERGEAAREGEAGVIQWIDGDRRGRELVVRSALQRRNVLHAVLRIAELSEFAEAAPPLPGVASEENSLRAMLDARKQTRRSVALSRIGRDVLLSCSRLNI